ncbi:hypothetical protein [Herbidospora sp. RD11066]
MSETVETDPLLLRNALADAVARIPVGGSLVIVDLNADGLSVFEIRRDVHGTPSATVESTPWTELTAEPGWELSDTSDTRRSILHAARVLGGHEVLVICSFSVSPIAHAAFEMIRSARPGFPAFRGDVFAADVLRDVLCDEPLLIPYSLVIAREAGGGRLKLVGRALFARGSRRGEVVRVPLRFAGRPDGTVLAVVTWHDGQPHPLSVRSARIAAGRHEVTFRLDRPGRVTTDGLPDVVREPREWGEIMSTVPRTVARRPPARHLICAIELCGPAERVDERLSRIRQMLTVLAGRPIKVSVVPYGAHSFSPRERDMRVAARVWAGSSVAAIHEIDRLQQRGAITNGHPFHPYASQVEDALDLVVKKLDPVKDGPAVLLTAGDRPPHPSREDGSHLPCPHRHDWRALTQRLMSTGVTMAAITDPTPDHPHPALPRIGAARMARLEGLDVRELSESLRLIGADGDAAVPFPFADN